MENEACILCGRPINAPEGNKLSVNITGFTEKPCEKCQGMMEKGFLLVGIVQSKTEDVKNPYRSGNLWVISNEKAKAIFEPKNLDNGACFIDVNDALALDLPDINLGYEKEKKE